MYDAIEKLDLTKPIKPVDFSTSNSELQREIASRQTAWDWQGWVGLLPDIDPVMRKLSKQGHEVLNELLGYGHLTSVIQSRKLGTLKKEYRWEPGTLNEEKPSEQAIRLRDAFVADLENIKKIQPGALYNLFSNILDAPFFGMVPLEILYNPNGSKIRIKDIRSLPYHWFGFDEHNKAKFISQNNPWEGESLPNYKFVILSHFPTYENPYGMRLLSRCFWPVQFAKGGVKFWLMLAEKFGMPLLFGKYPRGSSDKEQQKLLSNLMSMVQDAVAVGPEGSSLELMNVKSGDTNIHKDLKDAMDKEISEIILGQTSATSVGTQSTYASARIVDARIEGYQEADQMLVKIAMEEIASIYGRLNAADIPPPTLKWFEESDPKKEHAERDEKITKTGVKLTKVYYQRQYGFKDDEIEIVEDNKKTPADHSEFREKRFTPEQQSIENLVAQVLPEAIKDTEVKKEKLLNIIKKAKSPEELQALIMETFSELLSEGYEEIMSQGLLAADMWGRFTIHDS
ncbi:Portal protein [Candidatus Magnetomoraceae bacterium gMMP-15]